MTRYLWFCLIVFLAGSGCGLKEREETLRKKEIELSGKEQRLLLKENELAIREETLLQQQKLLDSAAFADTAFTVNPQLVATWDVRMTCTETTCPGSAIGDTKTETWDISYQGNRLIAKAMVGDKLVRVYKGGLKEKTVTLTDDVASDSTRPLTRMTVQMTLTGEKTMEGQREIVRENDCKIIYRLQLSKKQP